MRAVFVTLLLFSSPAFAWGEFGHRLVGELAERQLSPAARAAVAELLKHEPEPTLAGIAAWADHVREADLEDYAHSRSWHFINFPSLDCDYEPARDCPDGNCVIGAINGQARVLADRRQPAMRRTEALKFLVHLIGDAHQPLHAGLALDRGGNEFQVNVNGQGSNLHAVWDSIILRDGPRGITAYVAHLQAGLEALDNATVVAPNPAAGWALESCHLLREQAIYPSKRRIGQAYLDHFRPLAERRLQQASKRLAEVLEAALASG
jgi:hypothetical protein